MRFFQLIATSLVMSFTFSPAVGAETLRVGAAVSLKEALTEIIKAYEQETGDAVELSFGSSGQIQQQIRGGAEIDLFISAANKQVDELVKEGLANADTRRVVVSNTLVLVVPALSKDAPTSFAELASAKVKRIAIGEPTTVPAGQYAMQVLNALKIDSSLVDRTVYGTNVRQVLNYVEGGEVSAGIVYASDAKESGSKVHVVATADSSLHEPIVYPGIVVAASRKREVAQRLLEYLTRSDAQAVFKERGFSTVDATASAPASQPAQK